MPQPYRPDGAFTYWFDMDALRRRPKFAEHIGVIASMWAFIEQRMGQLVSVILHADALVGATIYGVIRAERARLDALDAIAKERLQERDYKWWCELQGRVTSVGKLRDAIVHGLWVIPPDGADGMVLIDSRKQGMIEATSTELSARQVTGMDNAEFSRYIASFERNGDRSLIYTEDDMLRTERDILALNRDLTALSLKLHLRGLSQMKAPSPVAGTPP